MSTVLYAPFRLKESKLFAYERMGDTRLLVLSNFTDQPIEYEYPIVIKRVLLHNYSTISRNKKITLRAFESMVLEVEGFDTD